MMDPTLSSSLANPNPQLPPIEEIVYKGTNTSVQDLCTRVNSLIKKVNQGKDISNSLETWQELGKQVSQMATNPQLPTDESLCLGQVTSIVDRFVKERNVARPLGPFANFAEPSLYPHIFSFLTDPKDLCQLRLVSQLFQKMADHDDLWEKICRRERPGACKKDDQS